MSYIFNKENYECAKQNGVLERFRGDEIANRVSETVTPNEQQALQTNMLDDLINGKPLSHLTEWNKYQTSRQIAIAQVDAEIAAFEAN